MSMSVWGHNPRMLLQKTCNISYYSRGEGRTGVNETPSQILNPWRRQGWGTDNGFHLFLTESTTVTHKPSVIQSQWKNWEQAPKPSILSLLPAHEGQLKPSSKLIKICHNCFRKAALACIRTGHTITHSPAPSVHKPAKQRQVPEDLSSSLRNSCSQGLQSRCLKTSDLSMRWALK